MGLYGSKISFFGLILAEGRERAPRTPDRKCAAQLSVG